MPTPTNREEKKYLKFDARPHMKIMYFPNTKEGLYSLEQFWVKNWLIGVLPKISKVNKRENV